jgi:CelD/BcsL family acetyltransferase involved in cellulose biosynthesis
VIFREALASTCPRYDEQVATAVDIDAFCSSSRWIVPAFEAFQARSKPSVFVDDAVTLAFAESFVPRVGMCLKPPDDIWGLGCPIVTPDAELGAARLIETLSARPLGARLALVTGILESTPLLRQIVSRARNKLLLRPCQGAVRHLAQLDDGLDGFLSRRSRKHRASLRNASRRASAAGVTFHTDRVTDEATLDLAFLRAMHVEQQSWKTLEGNGVAEGPMRVFTEQMLRTSVMAGDAVWFTFARQNDADVGYLHGVQTGDYFRGAQMSFAENTRPLSVGNLLQFNTITALCEAGLAVYDLGSSVPYKERWAERTLSTVSFILHA